jgi:hypothetical protein
MTARRLVVELELVVHDDGIRDERMQRQELLAELREGRLPAWVWEVAGVWQHDAPSLPPGIVEALAEGDQA